jgi:hybrid polyketide synthase/nonribosomal peptide synthetase FtdB
VGTYLITGGLTGVGLRIAQGLLDRGARHVLLVGRRPPSAEAQGQIDAWNQQGAVVKTAQADVADATALAAVLAAIDPSQPLRGLIHSVGVLEDAALVQQDWTRFAKVLAPKMLGAWHLHALTQDLPLDFFVLFSSMAGFLGSRGQANHAAANTFLDAFAAYRRARGLKASSIAWGAWSEIGAAAELIRRGGGERLAAQGFGIIAPEQGVKAFAEVLGLDKALIGVVPIDWAVFARQWARSDPFFSGLLATARQQPEARIQAGEDWRERLAATPAAALPECLLAYLEAQAVEILGFGPEESLDGNQPLNQVGLDSLMSIDLRSRVTRDLGLTLPVDVFMDASIAQLSARLATALANESAPAESPVTIPSVSRLGALPLSFMQEEVWRRSQIPALKGVYNLLSRFRFTGRLDRGVLRQSLDALVARHEILRTTYAVVDARPAQIIGPPAEVPLAVTDLRTLPEAAKAQAIERLATEEEGRPFDLERGPLLRAHLLELGDAAHLLLVATHHIAVDAWSINLLFTELGALYAAGIRGEPMALPAESIQYADFAHWQRATHTPETLVSRQAYWRELLAVPPPPLNLPTDHPRPAEQGEQTYPAGCARVELPPALIQDLKALGREHGATFYMVLLAAYAALLYRHGGCEDILIGAPTSKRNHPALERLVGHFAGRSWLRVDLAGNPSFLEALARTKRVVLSALENQYLTLRQWLDAVAGQVEGFSSRPLYAEATFNLWPPISGDIELPGACLSPIPIEYKVVHTDVALNLWEEPAADGALLKGFWLYRRDLFDPPRVERMVADFRALLEAAAADPAQSVTAIRLRSSSLRSLPLEKGEI